MIGCMKATETGDGGVFASLKREHTPGDEVWLKTSPGLYSTPIKAFICTRCRLVYVPEEDDDAAHTDTTAG